MRGYNFDFAMSAKLGEKVVTEIITKVVEEQTGKKVSKVEINVRNVPKGWGRDEQSEFDGMTVYFEN